MKLGTLLTAKLVFVTAFMGAFVAGLDAGLLYNTFPKMGDRWIPPWSDLTALDPLWKNMFENPTTVQLIHRYLGLITGSSIACLFFYYRTNRSRLPQSFRFAFFGLFGITMLQVSLGIGTLLYCVPISLASWHQAGSLSLLSFSIYTLSLFRRIPK
jgi:heme a synthase